MDGMGMVQSEMSISTSWKRILGMEQSDICFRPSINQDTRKTATWFMLFPDTTPMYQILRSRPVPHYRKFLKGICNKANLTNYISNYIMENEHSTREIDHLGWWIQHRKACEERYQINFVLSSLEGIYSNTGGADRRMILHASSLSRTNWKDHNSY